MDKDKDKKKDKRNCHVGFRTTEKEKQALKFIADSKNMNVTELIKDSLINNCFPFLRGKDFLDKKFLDENFPNKSKKNFFDDFEKIELLNYDPETGSRTYYDSNGILVIDIRCKQEV